MIKKEKITPQEKRLYDFVVKAIKDVMGPYMEMQGEKWQENEKRWQENEKRWQENEKRWQENEKQHRILEETLNAHTVDLHDIIEKLDAFADWSVQHHEKIESHDKVIETHEQRITSLETTILVHN